MGGKVFISHAPEDAGRCMVLVRAFSLWGVDYWLDPGDQAVGDQAAGQQLSRQAQMALADATVLLRVCTRATKSAYWMSLETGAFLGLHAQERRAGRTDRAIVNVVLDPAYAREPFDLAATFIDAKGGANPAWVNQLRAAIGLAPLADPAPLNLELFPPRIGMSRRQALGLGAAGAVALVAVAGGGALWLGRGVANGPLPIETPTPTPPVKDARIRWSRAVRDPNVDGDTGVSARVLLHDGVVYVGSHEGYFAWFDAATARDVRPTLKLGAPIYQPAVVLGDSVFFCTAADGGGQVYAYSTTTGQRLWTRDGPTFSFTTLTISGTLLYVGGYKYGGFITAFDPATGRTKYDRTVSVGLVSPTGQPAFADGKIYVSASDGYLYAVDAGSADTPPLWTADVGATYMRAHDENVILATGPTVAGGTAYVGSEDTYVYAIDTATGRRRWRHQTGGQVKGTPAVAAGIVYSGSLDHTLYALDAATGAVKWTYRTGGRIAAPPVLAGGLVYISSADSFVHALDAQAGTLVTKYPTEGQVAAPPLVTADSLYVSSLNGYVYAYNLGR